MIFDWEGGEATEQKEGKNDEINIIIFHRYFFP